MGALKQHAPDYYIVSALHHELGESPVWDHRSGHLVWVDAYSDGFYSTDLHSLPTHHVTGHFTIGITLWGSKPGRYLVTTSQGLFEWHNHSFLPVVPHAIDFSEFPSDSYRFNDVAAAPNGTFLAGVMEWLPTSQKGRLLSFPISLLLGSSGSGKAAVPITVLDHVDLPNGMGFSPDRRWFYFTDSLRKQILRFPYYEAGAESGTKPDRAVHARQVASGDFGIPEVFVDSADRDGVPDGMTVAADGTIFSARWGNAVIDRYDPNGGLIEQFAVPMERPSSVCFGGPDLSTLFVTSATQGIDVERLVGKENHNGFTIAMNVHSKGQQAIELPYI